MLCIFVLLSFRMNAVLLWICNALCRNLLLEVSFFRLLCFFRVFPLFFSKAKLDSGVSRGKKKETKKKQITTECLHIRVFKFSNECSFPMNMQSTLSQFASFYSFFSLSFLFFCFVSFFLRKTADVEFRSLLTWGKKKTHTKHPGAICFFFAFSFCIFVYFCAFLIQFLVSNKIKHVAS